jgi:LPS-assembly lipoprotein
MLKLSQWPAHIDDRIVGELGMGWRERGVSLRQALRLIAVFATAAACAGCFQPLYGESTAPDRPGLRDKLSAIDIKQIDAPANTAESRLAVQIRNDLLFNFTGGGSPQSPTHELIVKITGGLGGRTIIAVDTTTKLPTIESYTLSTTYVLTEIASKKVVVTGRASTSVSYDTLGTQRFARVSAMKDAERQAAKVLSDNITTRMASYLVSGI